MAECKEVQDEQCELVVVGAGLAALHLVSRLPESLFQGTVVVDSRGAWLAGWTDRCERLAAPHVRTPVTQHPHASPLALQDFAEKHGRQEELTPVVKGFAPVPSTALFNDFCRSKIVGRLPAAQRVPLRDTALRIEALEEGAGCRVHLGSGRVLAARAVIYTPANLQPVLPAWVRQLQVAAPSQPREQEQEQGLGQAEHPAPLQETSHLPAGIATSDSVDLRGAELAGKQVVVVGGGMSAGLLAAGAAERGAEVTLVCRRPLVPQAFECEVGWWGNKHLNGFRQLESAAMRIRACQRARRQGSLHLPLWRRLAQLAAAGRLTVLEGWEVAEASPLAQADEEASAADWQLSLTQRDAGSHQPTLFQQAVAATSGGSSPSSATSTPPQAQPVGQRQHQLRAQLVWLACGRAYNAAADPVLQQLQQQCPTLLAGGYPKLDDEHLCWPGAAVYVMGRGSLLSVGPCAGDLPGMRLAADRIANSLQRLDYADAPVWQAAQQRLLEQLVQQLGLAEPSSSGSGGGSTGSSTSEPSSSSAGEGLQLAAVAEQAAAALPALPLEEEGCVYEEPKPKVSVARPDNVVDVSDLDPALPRREVQQYKFTDDDFEICVICQLEEGVPLDQVRVLFGVLSLEMWAVGQGAAYHLHLPRLYGRVVPKKCKVKVNQKARKVYLLLHKERDAEWRFLKG